MGLVSFHVDIPDVKCILRKGALQIMQSYPFPCAQTIPNSTPLIIPGIVYFDSRRDFKLLFGAFSIDAASI